MGDGIGRDLTTLADFDAARAQARGFIVVTDKARRSRVHRVGCLTLQRHQFSQKVVENGGKNGRYVLVDDYAAAAGPLRAVPCGTCHPEHGQPLPPPPPPLATPMP